jgi:hypothetical protein
MQVIHQLPALVRLEGHKPNGAAVSFDGRRTRGLLSRLDETLLETFAMDSTEGMLAAAQGPVGFRHIGGGFLPDPRTTRNPNGPRMDIFEITAPVLTASAPLLRMKLYFVDSDTGLLRSTRYEDHSISPAISVETRFSEWGQFADSQYPGRIERYENGRQIFSFVVTAINSGPKGDIEDFR